MFFKKNKTSGLTEEIRVRRCYGCGSILQDQDPNEVGYVNPEKFNSGEETLCERCYKLRHFSSFKKSPDFNLDYVTILNDAKEHGALAVYVMNAFNPAGSIIDGIGKYLPKKILVLINKTDVLPDGYKEDELVAYCQDKLLKAGITPTAIMTTSSSSVNPSNIDKVFKQIDKMRSGQSVYFVGAYQVGKSSLINCLLMMYTNSTQKMITTAPYPSTTLDVTSIPLNDGNYIYDTPGIYNPKSIISFVEPEAVKFILHRNQIKPVSLGAKEGTSFLFSNFARIDFVKGSKTDFTFYKSNDLEVSKVKLSKADSILEAIGNDLVNDCKTNRIKTVSDLVPTKVIANKATAETIRIVGLGYINYVGVDQEITVLVPKGVEILLENGRR